MSRVNTFFIRGSVWAGMVLLTTLGVWFFSSAYSPPGSVAWSAEEKVPSVVKVDFASMVEKMTRTRKLYSINTFDTLLDVRVLYKSPALRSAFVEDFSARALLSEAQKAELKQKEGQAAQEGEEFLIAIYTTNEDWADLTQGNPAWHLYLYDDQNRRVEPKTIRKTSISSAEVWKFYHRVSPWTKLFLVTFPKTLPQPTAPVPQPTAPAPSSAAPAPQPAEPFVGPDTKQIKLVFAGVLGRTELKWELK